MGAPEDAGRPRGPTILVDADGCPVKEEVYRVARRYRLAVTLVANKPMGVPDPDLVMMVAVNGDFNAADDWIAEHAGPGDIVVTGDIPLAARCLARGARAIGPKGRIHSEDSIGEALATRALMAHLRECGEITGGPAPHAGKDRSRFLQRLDQLVQASLREARGRGGPTGCA